MAILKVAKGLPGSYTPLSGPELDRFRIYMDIIRFAGQTITSVSRSYDTLRLTVSVFYDGLLDPVLLEILSKQAVRDYLSNKLAFDGEVKTSGVVDAIQKLDGIKNVSITLIEAKVGIGAYASFSRVYSTFSGYIKLDETSTFTMVSQ